MIKFRKILYKLPVYKKIFKTIEPISMKLITKVYKVMTLEIKTQFGENFKGIVSFFSRGQ